ncbi:MAG: IS3 family transposase [Bacteroidota bacterium]|nr:IS3 family transposase [Bacteroidota bacterium]
MRFTLKGEDNLLCLRKKRWIRTTDSAHGYRIYPNLAQGIALTHPNQLWVSDITYVRLVREFVYAAIILDAFSRRVIGWALSRHIDAQLSLSALEMALETRTVMPGLIHHSDQGVQYAATEYTDLLKAHSISVSMSRRGNPYDNAMAESFIKTLKYEEVHLNEYETFNEAYENIRRFIDDLYNLKRLHSSLTVSP